MLPGPCSAHVDLPDRVLDSAIIGAGQAGLAASYFLRRRGIDHVVLDANPQPGGAWQHRWASLGMDDVHGVADLPGSTAPDRSRLAANVVVPDYFGDYERRQGLPVVRPVRVDRVESDGDVLVVLAGDREWRTRTLVNASGTWTRPFVPFYPGIGSFAGEQVHTAHYPGAQHFDGKRVLVVGGGASAVQFLGELAPVTDTLWVTRRPPVWREEFDASAGLAAVTAVEERVRRGLPPASVVSVTGLALRPQEQEAARLGAYVRLSMFERIEADGVRWADGRFERVDAILWATGFRPAVDHLAPLGLRTPGGRDRPGAGARQRPGRDHGGPSTRGSSWSATGRRPAPSARRARVVRPRWPSPASWPQGSRTSCPPDVPGWSTTRQGDQPPCTIAGMGGRARSGMTRWSSLVLALAGAPRHRRATPPTPAIPTALPTGRSSRRRLPRRGSPSPSPATCTSRRRSASCWRARAVLWVRSHAPCEAPTWRWSTSRLRSPERGARDPKELEEDGNRFHFRTSPRALDVLADAGVDVVSVANNHAGDYGQVGLADTLAAGRAQRRCDGGRRPRRGRGVRPAPGHRRRPRHRLPRGRRGLPRGPQRRLGRRSRQRRARVRPGSRAARSARGGRVRRGDRRRRGRLPPLGPGVPGLPEPAPAPARAQPRRGRGRRRGRQPRAPAGRIRLVGRHLRRLRPGQLRLVPRPPARHRRPDAHPGRRRGRRGRLDPGTDRPGRAAASAGGRRACGRRRQVARGPSVHRSGGRVRRGAGRGSGVRLLRPAHHPRPRGADAHQPRAGLSRCR